MSAQTQTAIPWPRRIAALFAGLSCGGLTGIVFMLILSAMQDAQQEAQFAIRFVMLSLPFALAAAIVPALAAGSVLLHWGWLRLHHFLAAGGIAGGVAVYALLLFTGGTQAIQNGSALIIFAAFAGVAGGGGAWAYLRLTKHIAPRPAP